MTTHRAGGDSCVSPEFELAAHQVLHAFVVHDQHDEVNRLSADLQAKATALNREERRIAPSLGSAATGDAASVLSAKYESGFQHRGHDGHALGRSHNFVGNAGIGSGLDFLQHCRRRFDAIRSLIVVVAGKGRGGKGQN